MPALACRNSTPPTARPSDSAAPALGALLAATLLGWWWAWGLWFLHWTAYGFATGRTFVLWTVTREEQPPLFWAAQAVWLVLAALFALA